MDIDLFLGCSKMKIGFYSYLKGFGSVYILLFLNLNNTSSDNFETIIINDKILRFYTENYYKLYFNFFVILLDTEINLKHLNQNLDGINISNSFLSFSNLLTIFTDEKNNVVFRVNPGLTLKANILYEKSQKDGLLKSLFEFHDANSISLLINVSPSGLLLKFSLEKVIRVSNNISFNKSKLYFVYSKQNGSYFILESVVTLKVLNYKLLLYTNAIYETSGLMLTGLICKIKEKTDSFTIEETKNCSNWLRNKIEGSDNVGNISSTNILDIDLNQLQTDTESIITIDLFNNSRLILKFFIISLKVAFKENQEDSRIVVNSFATLQNENCSVEIFAKVEISNKYFFASIKLSPLEIMKLGDFFDLMFESFAGYEIPANVLNDINNNFGLKDFTGEIEMSSNSYIQLETSVLHFESGEIYGCELFVGKNESGFSFSFQISNEEGVPVPPIPIIKEIADFLGIKKIYSGVSSESQLYEVKDIIDDLEESFKIPLSSGFYLLVPTDLDKNETLNTVCKFLGIKAAIFGAVIKETNEWRISLFLQFLIEFDFGKLTSGSLFVQKTQIYQIGVGFSIYLTIFVSKTDQLEFYGESIVGFSSSGFIFTLTVAMLNDWHEPFGLKGVTIMKNIVSITASPFPLKISELLLVGGIKVYEFSASVLFYGNFSIEKQIAILFELQNFDLQKLISFIFNDNPFSFIRLSFSLLKFRFVKAKESFTVGIPGQEYYLEPGLFLEAKDFDLFGVLKGSIQFELYQDKGFAASGEIKPFRFASFFEVYGFPEKKDPLIFDFMLNQNNFSLFFKGGVKLLIFEIVGEIDIRENFVFVNLLITIDWFEVALVLKARSFGSIEASSGFYLSFELFDTENWHTEQENEKESYFESKKDKVSVIEKVNRRTEGNKMDAKIKKEEEFSSDYEDQRKSKEAKEKTKYEDKKESGKNLTLKYDHFDHATNKKIKMVNKIEILESEINFFFYKRFYGKKVTKKIFKKKFKLDKLYLKTKKTLKIHSSDLVYKELRTQLFFGWIVNLFKKLLKKLKKAWRSALKLLNKLLDLVKKLIQLIIKLLKAIIRVIYIRAEGLVSEENLAVSMKTFVHLKLFSKFEIRFCIDLSIGNVDPVLEESAQSATENNEELNNSKKDVAEEMGDSFDTSSLQQEFDKYC